MFKDMFTINQGNKTIQGFIIRQKFVATLVTLLSTTLFVLVSKLIIGNMPSLRYRIERTLNESLYSSTFFVTLVSFLLIGIIFAVLSSTITGFFTARKIKESLQKIEDGNEAISKGRLGFRLDEEQYLEFDRIRINFNLMAEGMQRQVESLQRLVNENKKLVEGAGQAASIEERRKIARELHDAVSQQLFAISITMAALPKIIDTNPQQAKSYFTKVEEMVRLAQQELRALIMHLRPVTLGGDCLRKGVNKLLEELKEKNQSIRVDWELDDIPKLAPGIEDNLFRVIQESLSNTIRHSKATVFNLKLLQRDKRIILFLEDNGVGFDTNEDKKSSYGISTMKERIDEIGGRLDIISYPNKGTRIEIRVPIEVSKV